MLLLAGCSVMRAAGYSQAPNLLYWRLHNYLDFDEEQAPRVRAAIGEWFGWHRSTQLPDYAALLVRARGQLGASATPALACQWWDEVGTRADTALDHAAPLLADVALTLTPQQLKHLERRYAKSLEELRGDYLQSEPDDRRQAAQKRTLERFETVYGRFDAEQRQRVVAGVAASPFDAERFVAERAARHQDSLAVLRRLTGERSTRDAAVVALRELAAQTQRSPRPAYREYQRQLIDYNCAFAAEIHNLTTPAQRARASEWLAGWEGDVRSWTNGGN